MEVREIRRLIAERLSGSTSVVVCGVGNDLRGDDGVGLSIAARLGDLGLPARVFVLACGELPENYITEIVARDPSHVILIDALVAGKRPGALLLVESDEILGRTISTHRLPLSLLAKIISMKLGKDLDVFVLGVQVASCELGEGLSPDVRKASDVLLDVLAGVLGSL
jgi:hydrogenase 3 maturation protease